ncbi:hypothetical protein HHI36_019366 [Cryptolaemus montrouzieri]|uniref:SWIM-type domain-containing protein n=1 Tax=Cryptolaemus montrouzieri TaxID=559131 RepID=A0ABD2P2P2_9CUCU
MEGYRHYVLSNSQVIKRLKTFEEGYEKIFDVFDQTFPTAFVLSTGYWIFFVSNFGSPLCICGRFGIICRHVRSKNHWIDLQPLVERSNDIVFSPRIHGPVIPLRYEINVEYLDDTLGYIINIHLDLAYARMTRKNFPVFIQASYGYASQCYAPPFAIRFTPNPILKEQYGKYFDQLKNHRNIYISKYGTEDLIITPSHMPPSCLFLLSVNVEKYEIPSRVSAILLTEWRALRNKDVSTQTTENDELDHYRKLLEEVSNAIWKYQENSEVEMPILNDCSNGISCPQLTEYPVGVEDTNQYNQQYPDLNSKKNNFILEKSIPKPITCSAIQQHTKLEKLHENEKLPLPNFEKTFLGLHLPPPQTCSKRRRGRPKVLLADGSNMARSSKNPQVFISKSQEPCGSYHRSYPKQNADSNLDTLDDILKKSTVASSNMGGEDINFELELIDQLIKEESQKNAKN